MIQIAVASLIQVCLIQIAVVVEKYVKPYVTSRFTSIFHNEGDFKDGGTEERAEQIFAPDGIRTHEL